MNVDTSYHRQHREQTTASEASQPTECRQTLLQCSEPLAPAVHRLSAQHQSDNRQAASADCLTDVDAVISIYKPQSRFAQLWLGSDRARRV